MALFWHRKPYDIEKTGEAFFREMKENIIFQFRNCEAYRQALEGLGWNLEKLEGLERLEDFPFLPTLYFKHHRILSKPLKKLVTTATSSGTSGNKSVIGFDLKSLWRGLGMVSADDGLSVRLLYEIVQEEPRLAPYVCVLDVPSTNLAVMKRLGDMADGIVVWGGDGAISAVREMADPATQIISWGHKLSFAYAIPEMFDGTADSELELSYLFKNCWVKPLPRKQIVRALKCKRGYLQTVGLLCPEEKREELINLLVKAGVTRVAESGNMSYMVPGGAHDGEYALRRYSKIVEV